MSTLFTPNGPAYLVTCEDTTNGVDFDPNFAGNAVLVTNLDSSNAVAVVCAVDTGDHYAVWPTAGLAFQGTGVIVQPLSSQIISLNTTQFATNPLIAGTNCCDTGKSAAVVFNTGSI